MVKRWDYSLEWRDHLVRETRMKMERVYEVHQTRGVKKITESRHEGLSKKKGKGRRMEP